MELLVKKIVWSRSGIGDRERMSPCLTKELLKDKVNKTHPILIRLLRVKWVKVELLIRWSLRQEVQTYELKLKWKGCKQACFKIKTTSIPTSNTIWRIRCTEPKDRSLWNEKRRRKFKLILSSCKRRMVRKMSLTSTAQKSTLLIS